MGLAASQIFVRRDQKKWHESCFLITAAVDVFAEFFCPVPALRQGWILYFPILIFWKWHFQIPFLVLTGAAEPAFSSPQEWTARA